MSIKRDGTYQGEENEWKGWSGGTYVADYSAFATYTAEVFADVDGSELQKSLEEPATITLTSTILDSEAAIAMEGSYRFTYL